MKLSPRRVTVGIISAALAATTFYVPSPAFAASAGGADVRLIVGYKAGIDTAAAHRTMSAMGAEADGAADALAALGAQSVKVSAAHSVATMAALRANPAVDYVEVDHVRKVAAVTPNDPEYKAGRQSELKDVNLPAAWGQTTGSAVKIAVVDTGVNAVKDLQGQVLGGHDFVNNDNYPDDDYGHGTEVSALIAAKSNDGSGMAGVCWKCKILPVKVLDSSGTGYDSDIAAGVIWAVNHGASVINMSIGGAESSTVLNNATKYATLKNVLIVAAAGNESSSVRSYPAAYQDVLAVGATVTGTTGRTSFSNFNSSTDKWVDVSAPGIVTSMSDDGEYHNGVAWPKVQGTSFSSPIVAGIAGLVKTVNPRFTGWSVAHAILATARKNGSWNTYGLVDANRALHVGTDVTVPYISGVSPGQWTKVHGTITVGVSGVGDGWSGVRAVDLLADGVWKAYDQSAPYQLRYNTAGRNGTVKLGIRVTDKAGNTRTYYRYLTADNVAPSIKITKAPKNNAKIKGTVKIYTASSDKYGVKRVQLLINGKVVSTHANSKTPFSFKASKYPKKTKIQVRAYDVAGNVKYTSKLSYHR